MSDSASIVRGLLDAAAYPHSVKQIEIVETHISWVFLTGQLAYKIKKPVRLDFVDFSTLARRRDACHQELRLNQRFAPQIYLDVVEIAGTTERPVNEGVGNAIEYAVKMVQFPADARLDRIMAAGRFHSADCDQLANTIADIHRRASVAPGDAFGDPETIAKNIRDVLKSVGEQTRGGSKINSPGANRCVTTNANIQ